MHFADTRMDSALCRRRTATRSILTPTTTSCLLADRARGISVVSGGITALRRFSRITQVYFWCIRFLLMHGYLSGQSLLLTLHAGAYHPGVCFGVMWVTDYALRHLWLSVVLHLCTTRRPVVGGTCQAHPHAPAPCKSRCMQQRQVCPRRPGGEGSGWLAHASAVTPRPRPARLPD